MNRPMFAQWRLSIEVWLWRHGWGWALAGLLGITCMLVWAFFWVPQRDGLVRLESTHAELRLRQESSAAARQPVLQRTAGEELAAVLPHEKQADRLIARTLALARQHGVVIDQADYQYRQETDTKWLQLNMSLPLRGSYPQTRRFIEAVLREHPHLAMNQIGFKRDASTSSQLEAVVSFSAWFTVMEVGK
jgi:Tfp pilus assembly protein PilO